MMLAVTMRRMLTVLCLTEACALSAQVVELSGGSSTLYQSQGGSLSIRGRSYSLTGGGGLIAGHVYTGGQMVRSIEGARLTGSLVLGTDNVPFDLPTDIFQGGHFLTVIGAGLRTHVGNTRLYGFLGESSTSFNSPFFLGARAERPAVILFATGKVAPHWTGATRVLIPLSAQATVIHSMAYDNGAGTQFAAAGGLGAGQLYGASSLMLTRRRYDLKLAYIGSSAKFRRANVDAPLTAEPEKENVELTVRPTSWSSVSVGRQNFLTPVYLSKENVRSSIDQASGSVRLLQTALSATIFHSTYGGGSSTATAYAASRSFGSRVMAQGSYLISRSPQTAASRSLIVNVEETLTPRWTVSEMVNRSGGNTTLGAGGSFLSNLATVSVQYQTFYVPARVSDPFEQALIVNAQLHLFGRLTVGGGTFVAPDGRLLYTVQAEGSLSRELAPSTAGSRRSLGAMLLRGRVVDDLGQPIMGAAVQIEQATVYTDSQGYFYLRERRSRQHAVSVLVDQFLDGGLYKVISAPVEARSTADRQSDMLVIVRRVAAVGS